MTNHWIDLKNADCIMIIGSNAAENHPMAFKWVDKALETGAKLIHVDPRYTRTSTRADIHAAIRPGTDIAFVGGIINYCLENRAYNQEYVNEYTNASYLVSEQYDFNDGLFAGYDPINRGYSKEPLAYQTDENGIPKKDKTLSDPRCVFQLLKKHYSRYTPDMVSKIAGISRKTFLETCNLYCETGTPGKAGTILYAMGTTQHTVGSQNVRSYAILQLLLGNIGIPGGGVNALRGESNVQGSTDFGLLYHLLPGYLKSPTAVQATLKEFLDATTPKSNDPESVNYWKNTPKFVVSLLKTWWGDAATRGNDFCYDYLPKSGADYSHMSLFDAMYKGAIKGLFLFGQNPVVGGPNANKERKALDRLDWMVAVDLWETDTSVFWKCPGTDPGSVKTEVFLLPAAASFEKEGSVSNSGRWCQWRYKATNPPGQALPDMDIISRLFQAVRKEYAGSSEPKDRPILDLNWDYGQHVDPHQVAKEINGHDLKTGKLLASFASLTDDGSTTSGCWIYCGGYTESGNMYARRENWDPTGLGLYPKWAWAWPVNRRIIYNRASADASGRPWNPEKALVAWDASNGGWITNDVPDFVVKNPAGEWLPPETSAKSPFIMRPEGVGCLFTNGMTDGPFPEHYEPWESPVPNMMSSQQINPATAIRDAEMNPRAVTGSLEFPLVGTTYRVTEHWQAGAMTRNLPWLAELMPELFVEISEELARAKGIRNGEIVCVVSPRGEVQAKACVTKRFRAFKVDGVNVEVVGLPWHFGYNGFVTGGKDRNQNYAANQLTAHIGDANSHIPEYKVFACDVRKVV